MPAEPSEEPFLPRVEAHIVVHGDFDPAEFTNVASVAPTRTRRRGERLGESLAYSRADTWRLVLGPVQTMDGTEQISRALVIVEKLNERLSADWHGETLTKEIVLVAYVPPHRAQAVPNVTLDHSLLRRLAEVDVDLVFDFMLLDEDQAADGPAESAGPLPG